MDCLENRVSAEDFVILPWGCMPGLNGEINHWGSTGSLDDMMKELWECGFNATVFAPTDVIPTARKYGLSVIIEDSRIPVDVPYEEALDTVREVIGPFEDDPAVLGVLLKDEPSTTDFPNLGKWAKAIVTAGPNKLPYINLFPNYATPEQLGVAGYGEYIDRFVSECNPRFLSYDNYSLFEGKGLDSDQFYSNLELMREKSLEHNLPFWNIVLGNTLLTYAEPTQANINVQVYSSLAYGARGISYFTYFSLTVGNFRLGAIDQFDNKTRTWDYMRFMNLQIHKLAPIYLKLRSVNVFHHPNVPVGCKGIVSSKILAGVDGGDLLVGEFEAPDGIPYVMVVNKSLTQSTYFDVEFKEKGEVMFTNSYTGAERAFDGENIWLAPGQGMLLHVKRPDLAS